MTFTLYDLGLTFYFATCFLFTGLAVSVALRAGLFNVGCEGQLQWAALLVAAAGTLTLPAPLSFLFLIVIGISAGAMWAGISGVLRAKFAAHEVLTTIMLNFIALALCQWVTVDLLQDPESQNPQTRMMNESFQWSTHDPVAPFFDGAPVNIFMIVAVLAAVGIYFWFERSRFALQMKAVGLNPVASRVAGVGVERIQVYAMMLSGALAAGVSLNEVMGSAGQYRLGFSSDFGFVGIAVALVARGNPLWCVPSALFFASLQTVTQNMELESKWMTRDMSFVFQGLMILLILLLHRRRKQHAGH